MGGVVREEVISDDCWMVAGVRYVGFGELGLFHVV